MNNTSKPTENDLLDSTFGGYDAEMTAQTEDPHTINDVPEKKKNNSNMIIFGIGGVAALGVVGYMFLHGKPVENVPQQQTAVTVPPVQQSVQSPIPQPIPQPVQPPVQQPVQPPVQQSVQSPVQQSVQSPVQQSVQSPIPQPVQPQIDDATNFLSNTKNPMVGNKDVTPPIVQPTLPIEVKNNNIKNPMLDNKGTIPSQSLLNNSVVSDNAKNNVVQQQLVSQIKDMFDSQTKEIKDSVDQVGNRVSALEKVATEQTDINKSIEDRLVILESGKRTKYVATDIEGTAKIVKHKHKKHTVKKVMHEKTNVAVKKDKSENTENNDVLIDKSSEKPVVTYPAIQIYSVYAGRVWIKNKDGSLSTFAESDKLPTGELIKRVDAEKSQIITDKRVIK
jgi:hypothetical protein